MKVLMVCLGNICRSPLAQGILESLTHDQGLSWEVDSAGTSAWHIGNAPDGRSIKIAKHYGIDISTQTARQFTTKDFHDYDLILAMDQSNYNNILKISPDQSMNGKVKMIMNYVDPGMNEAVPDPYYDDGFDNVYQMLHKACQALIKTV